MKLCFDATRFGFGLKEAVELASQKGIAAVEYSFDPFPCADAASRKLTAAEKEYLQDVRTLSSKNEISIAALKLNYLLNLDDKDSLKQFKNMVEKLSAVAKAVDCQNIIFWLAPTRDNGLAEKAEKALGALLTKLEKQGLKLVLSLSTPACHQGKSLRYWRSLEPQEWRQLLAELPNLALSFSAADCVWQGIDYLKILSGLVAGISHVEAPDVEVNRGLLADSGLFGPLWWTYRTPGKGQVDWRQLIEALKLYEFAGHLSIRLLDEHAEGDPQALEEALDSSVRLLAPLVKY